MNWYFEALRKYAEFSGRSRRKEFWFFILFNTIFVFVLTLIDLALGTYSEVMGIGLLGALYSLAVLIPALAVIVRRIHDTGNSGWWVLATFIPLIGLVVLIVFGVMDSEPGENKYGPNPKEVAAPVS